MYRQQIILNIPNKIGAKYRSQSHNERSVSPLLVMNMSFCIWTRCSRQPTPRGWRFNPRAALCQRAWWSPGEVTSGQTAVIITEQCVCTDQLGLGKRGDSQSGNMQAGWRECSAETDMNEGMKGFISEENINCPEAGGCFFTYKTLPSSWPFGDKTWNLYISHAHCGRCQWQLCSLSQFNGFMLQLKS